MLRYPYDRLPLSRWKEKCAALWHPLSDDQFEYGGSPPPGIDMNRTQFTGNRGEEARRIRTTIANQGTGFLVQLNTNYFVFRSARNLFLPDTKARFDSFGKKLANWYESEVEVSSAYRSPAHNARVGGRPNSWHTAAAAMDIIAKGKRRYEIADLAVGHGFG